MSKYKLVIVESPAKAKTIEKYLGSEYRVIASKGHILDLPKKALGVDLNDFSTKLEPLVEKESTIKEIVKMAKDASEIFLASDADREGESIAFHLKEIIKRKDVKRVLINSITKKEIIDAINKAGPLDQSKYEAQQARRILDRLIGYKISPILWDKLQGGLSAGRVQSVALKIIVKREEEIKNFIPEKWFDIIIYMEKDGTIFESKYFGSNKDKLEKIKDEEIAKNIIADIDNVSLEIVDLIVKQKEQLAPPPFTTSKLQQEAAYKIGLGTKDTMKIAQKLYEGVDIKNVGRTGLITYMRTDSVRSAPEAIDESRKLIESIYGKEYLSKEIIIHKQKKTESKVQDAHEAIRPTRFDLHPDKIKDDLTKDEYDLYKLIWNKFIASQMAPAIIENTTIFFKHNNHFFKSSGNVIMFDGYKKVSIDIKDKDEDEGTFPKMSLNEMVKQNKKSNLMSKMTSPPPRFNEGTLVKELEDKGIGRPATYAAIIDNIISRKYIIKHNDKDKRLEPTEIGFSLCKMLDQNFPIQMDYNFTSKTEKSLDDIEEGTLKYKELLKTFWEQLSADIEKVNKLLPSIERPKDKSWLDKYKTGIKCLLCTEGEYVIKNGKNGEFLACSEYPKCNSTQAFERKNDKIKIVDKNKKKYSEEKCRTCSKRMVVVETPNNKFLTCEDYPNCKTTASIPSKHKCLKCPDGKLVERKSKNGNFFHSCSKYPACDFVIWDELINKKCKFDDCNNSFITKNEKTKNKSCPKCKKDQK